MCHCITVYICFQTLFDIPSRKLQAEHSLRSLIKTVSIGQLPKTPKLGVYKNVLLDTWTVKVFWTVKVTWLYFHLSKTAKLRTQIQIQRICLYPLPPPRCWRYVLITEAKTTLSDGGNFQRATGKSVTIK